VKNHLWRETNKIKKVGASNIGHPFVKGRKEETKGYIPAARHQKPELRIGSQQGGVLTRGGKKRGACVGFWK